MMRVQIAIVLCVTTTAWAAPGDFKAPADGKEACERVLAKASRDALLPGAKLEARLVAHGGICAFAADAATRAIVIVQCPGSSASATTDGDWSDTDDGLAGTIALGAKATFVQRVDERSGCVVTVEATGAWTKSARDLATAVRLGYTVSVPVDRAPPRPEPEPIVVVIAADGRMFLAGKPIEPGALQAALAKAAQASKDAQLVIKADRHVAHSVVVQVLDRAKAAGIQRMALGTAP